VSTTLPTPLTVLATSGGVVVSGLSVTFRDNKAGGVFSPNPAITNSSGIASTSYTLPSTPGTITINAGNVNYSTATFTETATNATSGKVITVTGGNNQTGAVGTTLPTPLSVSAANNGVPVVGLSVSFIDGKKGTFSPNPAVTNSSGIASTNFTLPVTAGTITVTAGAIGYTSASLTETATATVKTLAVNGGNNQTGTVSTALPTALTVLATTNGTATSGVSVSFTDGAGGTFSPNPAISNSSGIASTIYTLPATAGTYTVTGSSSGYTSTTFTETAQSAVSVTQLQLVSGGKQTGTVGTALPLPIVIRAKNGSATVTGASISFTDGAGGKFSPNPAITDSTGQASTTYTLPTVAESLVATASVGSVSVTASEKSVAAAASKIAIVSGNNQSANPNTLLPSMLIVSVTDLYGNPISGYTVTFTDNGAGGTFSTTVPVTNSFGQAQVSYTTGSKAGTITISAGSTATGSVNFTETVN
jgi:hypothetical protein